MAINKRLTIIFGKSGVGHWRRRRTTSIKSSTRVQKAKTWNARLTLFKGDNPNTTSRFVLIFTPRFETEKVKWFQFLFKSIIRDFEYHDIVGDKLLSINNKENESHKRQRQGRSVRFSVKNLWALLFNLTFTYHNNYTLNTKFIYTIIPANCFRSKRADCGSDINKSSFK